MEAQVAAPHHHHHQQKAANLARTFTKLLCRKRSDAAAQGVPEAPASVVGAGDYEEERAEPPVVPSLNKLKLSGTSPRPTPSTPSSATPPRRRRWPPRRDREREWEWAGRRRAR
jgi:hypothetical protein